MKNANLRVITLGLLAATVFPSAMSGQQPSQKACDLLTPAELGSVIGGNAGHASGKEIPYHKNPQLGIEHEGVLYECVQSVGARKATVRYSTSGGAAESKKKAEAVAKDAQKVMENLGYQVQFNDVGGSHCTTLLPFAGAKGNELIPVGTTCVLEKGEYFVSIQVSGTNDVLPAEKVATLAEKAAARLPSR